METTRHFCATVYVVRDGAVALHRHDRADTLLPPGGHIDRDELPREAARREVREETGRDVTLATPPTTIATDRVRERPAPVRLLLVDVHQYGDGSVAHQHLDFVYYGRLASGPLDPQDDGLTRTDWSWFGADELRADPDVAADVAAQGLEAIERIGTEADRAKNGDGP
ncbi:MAG: NUDIX domain-containing protein [Halobacteriaceae archaeon]